MHDHLTPTPDTKNETVANRPLPKDELDSIELQVREHLDKGDSEEELRALTSALLEAAGQDPLSEGETERMFTLDIDGEETQQTIVIDPFDFGTFVRSVKELGIDGLAETEASHEADSEPLKAEHDLARQALKEAINEGADDPFEDQAELVEEELEEAQDMEAEQVASPELTELLKDPSWKDIDTLAGQMKRRTGSLINELDNLDRLLARLNYEGGRTATSTRELNESLDSLRRITAGSIDEDLASRTRSLRNRGEEMLSDLRTKEETSDDDRHKARLTEENLDELAASGRIVNGELEEIRTLLRPYGRFESNIEELIRTTTGYQTTIAVLKAAVKAATEHTTMAYGRIGTIEARIEDATRLRDAR